MTPIVLLGHGSPDPRSAAGLRSLARAVARRGDGRDVHAAFLDHDEPGLTALTLDLAESGHASAIVVPVFLTSAYHVRSDIPRAVAHAEASSGLHLDVTPAIGPDAELVAALDDRLPSDAPVVLACAGTRDSDAQRELERLAAEWSARRGTEVVVGHASMGTPDVATAITRLVSSSEVAPVVASYVLFPGVLADRIAQAAFSAGLDVTAPLGDDAAGVVLRRANAAIDAGDAVSRERAAS